MPRRSSVEQLPPAVKEWLDKALLDGNFSQYQALSDELRDRGYDISKSAIHRYGKSFEDKVEKLKVATEQAKAIAEAAPDDADHLGDALTRLVQQRTFDILMDLDVAADDVSLPAIGKIVADINKTTVARKKWAVEVRAKAQAAATEVEKVARAGGLSPEAIQSIRTHILGIT